MAIVPVHMKHTHMNIDIRSFEFKQRLQLSDGNGGPQETPFKKLNIVTSIIYFSLVYTLLIPETIAHHLIYFATMQ